MSRSALTLADVDTDCGQLRAHGDDWQLRSASHLKHVEVAVAVAGVERFHGHGDEEIALSVVANAFAARGVADAFGLVQRMRDVIGERGLVEDPLTVRGVGELEPRSQKTKTARRIFAFI